MSKREEFARRREAWKARQRGQPESAIEEQYAALSTDPQPAPPPLPGISVYETQQRAMHDSRGILWVDTEIYDSIDEARPPRLTPEIHGGPLPAGFGSVPGWPDNAAIQMAQHELVLALMKDGEARTLPEIMQAFRDYGLPHTVESPGAIRRDLKKSQQGDHCMPGYKRRIYTQNGGGWKWIVFHQLHSDRHIWPMTDNEGRIVRCDCCDYRPYYRGYFDDLVKLQGDLLRGNFTTTLTFIQKQMRDFKGRSRRED